MADSSYPELVFKDSEDFDANRINKAMQVLDGRLRALEGFSPQWQGIINQLQQIGLQRLNDALLPIYDQLTSMANLGAIFQATSSTSAAVETGTKTFIIDEDQRGTFAPARWLSAMTPDATISMAGLLVSYDLDTGELVLNIMEAFGSGTGASWQISPSCPPLLAAAVIDDGNVDDTPSEIHVPYIYDGPTETTGFDAGEI